MSGKVKSDYVWRNVTSAKTGEVLEEGYTVDAGF